MIFFTIQTTLGFETHDAVSEGHHSFEDAFAFASDSFAILAILTSFATFALVGRAFAVSFFCHFEMCVRRCTQPVSLSCHRWQEP